MKQGGSGLLSTIGSISLCRSLQAGLVDRFRVVMFPVITGATGAERIYDGYPDVALEMIDNRTSSTAVSNWSSTGPASSTPPLGLPHDVARTQVAGTHHSSTNSAEVGPWVGASRDDAPSALSRLVETRFRLGVATWPSSPTTPPAMKR